jgi:ATP-dependent DNA ligase
MAQDKRAKHDLISPWRANAIPHKWGCNRRAIRRRARLVAGADSIQFGASVSAEGATGFTHACQLGLEGIVSKRVGSRYRGGPSRNWLKSKNPAFQRMA